MKPIILSLDLGTKTGWALSDEEENITSGTENFNPKPHFDSAGIRYLNFRRWLNITLELAGEIGSVYYESVRSHKGTNAAHVYGGFMATLATWCEGHEILYKGVDVGTIKKFIAGKGNAGKPAIIEAVKALGHNPKDDNEADALALMYYARKDL